MSTRPHLNDLELSTGKKTRLHRLLHTFGPGNGTLLLLPIDQGLEHGPRDFWDNPDAANPEFQLRLAKEGGFSGIVFQVGIAAKYMHHFAGEVPLVLKLNGKTELPSDDNAFSPCMATVEDAVRMGADAVGYTLYVGSPAQDRDFTQFGKVRADAEKFGMPIIVWAYPRGQAVEAKGGKESFYAIDYAARVAAECGADIVKLNVPVINADKDQASPKPYSQLSLSAEEAMTHVIRSAGRMPVLVSGGSKLSDDDLIAKARLSLQAGATGLIFGRNIWQRPYREALSISQRIRDMMLQAD